MHLKFKLFTLGKSHCLPLTIACCGAWNIVILSTAHPPALYKHTLTVTEPSHTHTEKEAVMFNVYSSAEPTLVNYI